MQAWQQAGVRKRLRRHSPHLPNLACSAQVKSTPGAMSVQLDTRSGGGSGEQAGTLFCIREPGCFGRCPPAAHGSCLGARVCNVALCRAGCARQASWHPAGMPGTSAQHNLPAHLRWSVSGTQPSWRVRAGTHPPSGRPATDGQQNRRRWLGGAATALAMQQLGGDAGSAAL